MVSPRETERDDEALHGEAALRRSLAQAMTQKLAGDILALHGRGLTYRELAGELADGPEFGRLQPLAQKWVRKSPQFFGECVVAGAREALQ